MVAKFQLNKMPIIMDLKSGTRVRSQQFGLGTVEFDKGTTVIVRFDHALEECEKNHCHPTGIEKKRLAVFSGPATRQVNEKPKTSNRVQVQYCPSALQPYSQPLGAQVDRKSTRLNSSHLVISYAVFC